MYYARSIIPVPGVSLNKDDDDYDVFFIAPSIIYTDQ
jgi:hypothetical protein